MKLLEHRAKRLLDSYGVPIPEGYVVKTPEEVRDISYSSVLKAQVPVGGRRKAGGVIFVSTLQEARTAAAEILKLRVSGYSPKEILVERKLDIVREIYLSITIDRSGRIPLLMASSEGGIEIETVPDDKIWKWHIHPFVGVQTYQIREIRSFLRMEDPGGRELSDILKNLWKFFWENDCELAEINPLVLTKDGRLMAGDAKITINDDSLYRHKDLVDLEEELTPLERKAKESGIAFVQLDGNIGVIANGAGLTMATLDNLDLYGGRGGVFLDLGGTDDPKKAERAFELMIEASPKVILLNIFGGMTKCDNVAAGVLAVKEKLGISVPVVARIRGMNEQRGREMLSGAGMIAVKDLDEACRRASEIGGS
ncbi:MAG: ADP-forming succinate--CoA ligase subunit beta [Methanomassiliicoccales archaeon]|nr:ADP-forming succinate--CoA ligase subunit beta [Methanomassiliicoccales archaeon]